ncbi:MAG: hypothetical protein PUG60_02985 [Lachnospiraceae bacterium]|nr:hypothetical protein [Lachnospiraceae bacterium]MDY4971328.1 hypothetical protein [Lachnospiraceae bacterium]
MKTRERMSRFGKEWGITVLALFAACLILAAGSVYMADRMVDMTLSRQYMRYMTVQEKAGIGGQPYNDGIYRRGMETAVIWDDPDDFCRNSEGQL